MSTRPTVVFAFLFAAATLCSGCLYSREIAHTRRDFEVLYPEAEFHREIVVSLGPTFFRFAGWMSGLLPEEETRLIRDYLHDIRRVKVGVYRVYNRDKSKELDPMQLRRLQKEGWETAVKVRENDERVWLLYRENRQTVRDLYLFVLDDEDLVIVRFQGHLSRLLQRAIEEQNHLTDAVRFR